MFVFLSGLCAACATNPPLPVAQLPTQEVVESWEEQHRLARNGAAAACLADVSPEKDRVMEVLKNGAVAGPEAARLSKQIADVHARCLRNRHHPRSP